MNLRRRPLPLLLVCSAAIAIACNTGDALHIEARKGVAAPVVNSIAVEASAAWVSAGERADAPAKAPPSEAPIRKSASSIDADKPTYKGKLEAPVVTALEVSGTRGEINATVTVTAERALTLAKVRFRVPSSARLLSGTLESELGSMKAGEKRRATIALRAPTSGSHVLSASVSVESARGSRASKSSATRIGPEPRPVTTRVKTLPDGTGVRLAQ